MVFPRWADNHAARQERYDQQVGRFLQRHGHQLPTRGVTIVEALRTRLAAVLTPLTERPPTLVHADLHLNNVLFSAAAAQERAVIIDWQTTSIGPATVDLSMFLVGSLSIDDRRLAEDTLLQHYTDLLAAHGVHYSGDDLRRDYQRQMLSLLAGIVSWLASSDPDQFEGRERALLEAALGDGRLITALLDHNLGALVNN
jgi:thiamine kinase-like enzyme